MKRGSRVVQVREWTERLFRFQQSGLSVSQFCQREAVSPATFYRWRKKLGRSAVAARRASPSAGLRQNGRTSPRGSTAAGPASSVFRPVQLTAVAERAICLTVRLPGGTELAMDNDPALVELVVGKVLEQAARHPITGKRERSLC